jgi:peptidoglycan hydrolase FlgJ
METTFSPSTYAFAPPPAVSSTGLKDFEQNADTEREDKLRKACGDFEAIILRQMLAAMRKSVPENEFLGNSDAQKMYQEMHDQKLADNLSEDRGTGLGEMLYKQLSGQSSATILNGKS